jgi:hypothetical protein
MIRIVYYDNQEHRVGHVDYPGLSREEAFVEFEECEGYYEYIEIINIIEI